MSRKIKTAVIGYGHIGRRHASIISNSEYYELVAVCDTNKDSKPSDIPLYNSISELISSEPELDLVSICTPNGLHAEQALECIHSGINILIEKPIALSYKDAEEIKNKATRHNVEVFVVMQNRYSPPADWLKKCIQDNLLGEIYHVQVNCYWNRDERYYAPNGTAHPWKGTSLLDGGTLFTQFSHFVDLTYWLFGDLDIKSAVFANHNHKELIDFEDTGTFTFTLANEATGSFSYSTSVHGQNLESSILVIGEKGTVKLGGQYVNKLEKCEIEGVEIPVLPDSNPSNEYNGYRGSANNHPLVFENIKNVLLENDAIDVPLDDGIAVVKIIEEVYKLKI